MKQRDADGHLLHTCAICQEVVAIRAREASQWERDNPDWWDRCSMCGFMEGHAPDCEMVRGLSGMTVGNKILG